MTISKPLDAMPDEVDFDEDDFEDGDEEEF